MSDYINQADIPVKETIAHALGFDADGNWAKMVPADPADVRAAQSAAAEAKKAAIAADDAAHDAQAKAIEAANAAGVPATTETAGTVIIGSNIEVGPTGRISVPVARATTPGVIKTGAGLTTEADGTTCIADNAYLPGVPGCPDNTNEGRIPDAERIIATHSYIEKTLASFAFGIPTTPMYRRARVTLPSFSGEWTVYIPSTGFFHPVELFTTFLTKTFKINVYLISERGTTEFWNTISHTFGDDFKPSTDQWYRVVIYPFIALSPGMVFYDVAPIASPYYKAQSSQAGGEEPGRAAEVRAKAKEEAGEVVPDNEGEEAADA